MGQLNLGVPFQDGLQPAANVDANQCVVWGAVDRPQS